jgi:hypothetical protein
VLAWLSFMVSRPERDVEGSAVRTRGIGAVLGEGYCGEVRVHVRDL